jgi:nucleoside-diphosphate-sugar epimerase
MGSEVVCIGVTGSTGVLGQALLKHWLNTNKSVNFIRFRGDIQNYSDIHDWLNSTTHWDGILHFAALVPTIEVDKDPLKGYRINTLGTMNLLEACRQRFVSGECPWIFAASTSHVYSSSPQEQCVAETSPLNPVSTYGLTKAQGDQWAEVYRSKYNLPICTGRIFSYSSLGQASSFFIPSLVQKIRDAPHSSKLVIRGLDGTRDFVTVEQVINAIQFLFEQKRTGVFNIGTGTAVRLFDIALAVKVRLGRDDLEMTSTGSDINHLVADVKKLNEIGHHASFNMSTLLDSFFS